MQPSRSQLRSAGTHYNLNEDPGMPNLDFEAIFRELEEKTSKIEYDPSDHNYRFTDIKCPSATRVRDSENVYGNQAVLHANQVTLEGRTFIATQYPLPDQFSLFWKVAARSCFILDLTNGNDLLKRNLVPYYPPHGAEAIYHSQSVRCKEVDNLIKNSSKLCTYTTGTVISDEPPAVCTRVHFEGWQDNGGISEDEIEFLLEQIERRQKDPKIPVIIHCSAGVGRTGTLIVASALKKRIHDGYVHRQNLLEEIESLVLEGRKQRGMDFVNSPEQLSALFKWGWREIQCPRRFQ